MSRIIIVLLLALALAGYGVSMTSTYTGSGYQMVITGNAAEAALICSFGDCSRLFPDRVEATNYFLYLWGQANGHPEILPIPTATTP